MSKIRMVLVLSAMVFAQPVLAHDMDMSKSEACTTVAKACSDAGFDRTETTAGKNFWLDCMKPVVLGKTVEGVTVDSATVKTCRTDKVSELKKELKEFQK